MTRQDWYVATPTGEVGPYTWLELRELAQPGRIRAHTRVRRGDMPQPVRADQVPGLVEARPADAAAAPGGAGSAAAPAAAAGTTRRAGPTADVARDPARAPAAGAPTPRERGATCAPDPAPRGRTAAHPRAVDPDSPPRPAASVLPAEAASSARRATRSPAPGSRERAAARAAGPPRTGRPRTARPGDVAAADRARAASRPAPTPLHRGGVLSAGRSATIARFARPAATARLASWSLGLAGLLQVVLLRQQLVWERLLGAALAGQVDERALRGAHESVVLAQVAAVMAMVVALVAFLVWLHRCYANLGALDAVSLRSTPGWAVGCFFVPVVNLVKPYRVVLEILRVSTRSRVPAIAKDRVAIPGSGLVLAWWTTWVLALVVLPALSAALAGGPGVSPAAALAAAAGEVGAPAADALRDAARRGLVLSAAIDGARLVAAVAAVLVVRAVTRRQQAAAVALGAARAV